MGHPNWENLQIENYVIGTNYSIFAQWMCQNIAQMPLNFSQLYLFEVLDMATIYAFFEKLATELALK